MTIKNGIFSLDEAAYHRDPLPEPSLSSSIARLLINRSPRHAWTRHPRLNPDWTPPDGATRFDIGSAAHRYVLGDGPSLVRIDAADYHGKDARNARDEARAKGLIPILAADLERVEKIAHAFRDQIDAIGGPVAELFDMTGKGRSEVTIAWEENGFYFRGRPDRVLEETIDGTHGVTFADYKTTSRSAHPAKVSRSIFDLGQDFQSAFYRRGLMHLGKTIFGHWVVTQEVEEPFALSVVGLSPAAWQVATQKVDVSVALWKRCMAENDWPLYPAMPAEVDIPTYLENDWIERRDAITPEGLTILGGG